jgi:hypothetical protein
MQKATVLPHRYNVRIVCVLLAALLSIHCSEDEPASPATESGNLAGVVTRHKTGVGMPGVIVVLLADSAVVATTHTDASGRFDFGRLEAGAYQVRLTGLDLARLDVRFDTVEPDRRDVMVGGSGEELVFTILSLVPPRITGDVVCAGVPVQGTRLRVVGGSTDVIVTTSAQGRFAALDLAPGNYAVIPLDAPCPMLPAFRTIELRPGQSGEADFSG